MKIWEINLLTWGGEWLLCGCHSGANFAQALSSAELLYPTAKLGAGVSSRLLHA
jgi:hypothetical protein